MNVRPMVKAGIAQYPFSRNIDFTALILCGYNICQNDFYESFEYGNRVSGEFIEFAKGHKE